MQSTTPKAPKPVVQPMNGSNNSSSLQNFLATRYHASGTAPPPPVTSPPIFDGNIKTSLKQQHSNRHSPDYEEGLLSDDGNSLVGSMISTHTNQEEFSPPPGMPPHIIQGIRDRKSNTQRQPVHQQKPYSPPKQNNNNNVNVNNVNINVKTPQLLRPPTQQQTQQPTTNGNQQIQFIDGGGANSLSAWRQRAETAEREIMRLRNVLTDKTREMDEKKMNWDSERQELMSRRVQGESDDDAMVRAQAVIRKMQAEMRKTLTDARDREEKSNQAMLQMQMELETRTRKIEAENRFQSQEMIDKYRKLSDEARQQAEAEREASQLQALETRREMQKSKKRWEEDLNKRNDEIVEAAKSETAEIRQLLDSERNRVSALETEYRRLFDHHVKSFEVQMRDKVSGILSSIRSELEVSSSSRFANSNGSSSSSSSHAIVSTLRQNLPSNGASSVSNASHGSTSSSSSHGRSSSKR